ncbi:DUF885 domain-containing protein [Sphingomonadaceae bacterium]|nr:DUF885 domain-containing protein [Sphingomonadaceae bacterium]
MKTIRPTLHPTLRTALLAAAALPLAVSPAAAQSDELEEALDDAIASGVEDENSGLSTAPEAAQGADISEDSARDRMYVIFALADEANLKLNPLNALFRGDMRYADRLGDFLTDEYAQQVNINAQTNLDRLAKIDRSALNATDQIVYDVFQYNQRQTLRGNTDEIRALTEVRPVNHFSGFHTFYPTFASGQGAARFETVKHYEDNLSRHADYIAIGDRAIEKFREGMRTGVLETSLTIKNVIEQLDTQLAQPVEESPFWGPINDLPDDFSDEDTRRLTADYTRVIGEVYDSNRRMRDFLRDEYLPVARTTTGLAEMKGGLPLYVQMMEATTTLPLRDAILDGTGIGFTIQQGPSDPVSANTAANEIALQLVPDAIHELGLSEVARILEAMREVQAEIGFEGTLQEFFQSLRDDPKLQPESREWLTQDYYRLGRVVDEQIGDFFSVLPKTPLEIRPYEEFREKFQAGGSYQSGAPDGSRPGIFYFNAYDLPSRNIMGNTTLYLHEGAPGHHFQISLAQENENIPPFMRFGGNTAYVEGWALYSETLGYEMGLYDDPYARMGTLADEQLRAMRLVVDTGLHTKGWTRDQAIQYMIDNSSMGQTDATAEVERYIAIPTQALAYKIGALKIQELRRRAEDTLGESFDLRAFHAQVLGTGALPLPVLEKKINDWIAAGGGM